MPKPSVINCQPHISPVLLHFLWGLAGIAVVLLGAWFFGTWEVEIESWIQEHLIARFGVFS